MNPINPIPFTLCFLVAALSVMTAGATPPNVVVIISDDQGYADYQFMGHEMIETSALDQLAAESLVYKRGYVTTALCSPSLASMITGLYPHQHRTTGNDPLPGTRRTPWNDHFAKAPQLPKLLGEAGYLSLHTGKYWHGHPQVSGFTDDMGATGRHGSKTSLGIGRETMAPVYEFIEKAQAQSKPFLVWYAPFLPHTPHNPPAALERKYAEKGAGRQAKYYAMCEWFDQTCGQLLQHLETNNLSENTIIFYICDNGWGSLGKGSVKVSPYELGVRTPIMIKWPGKVAAKVDDKNLASNLDLMPTILAACGVDALDAPAVLPGINLLDPESVRERKQLFLENFTHDMLDADRPAAGLRARSVVTKDWKLTLWQDTHPDLEDEPWQMPVPTETTQLFRISEDPLERINLAADHPDRVKAMQLQLDAWWNPIPHNPGDEGLPIKHFVYRHVAGEGGGELNLKLTYPPDWTPEAEPLPTAVFYFGGGWHAGRISQFNGIAPILARRGMIVATPEYRTIGKHGVTPAQCLADAKSAMRFLLARANEFGIDTNRVVAGGRSAGGNLAAGLAYCSEHNTEGDDLSIDVRPAALLLINPVIDNGPGAFGHHLVREYWKSFSPMHNIEPSATHPTNESTPPPTLFLTGDQDQYTPIETAQRYKALSEANGGRCELVVFKDGRHGSPMVGNENFKRSMQAMEALLVDLEYVDEASE